MSDFVTKIEKKKLKDYTPEELQWCIDNEPGTGANHQAAAFELQRRQSEEMQNEMKRSSEAGSKNWYEKPVGITVLSVIAAVIVIFIGAILAHYWPAWFHS
jgi:hypothetical protein